MFLRRYILLLLTLLSFTLQAQQYPVDIQIFVTPPYPQSLRGYADSFEQKIQAHFLLKDLSTAGRPFALRFSLENFQGQTIAQTPDYITPYLVNLSPGVRRTLTNIDFKSLLRYENLYGINEATYNGLLPEGTYFIGLSLYDVATGRPVSNKGRAMIQVRRYSPPVLTMPQKGEVLTKKNAFQNILFQWMPRDIAPFMQYEFTLKEVWDLALVPEEAFMSGRLVYQTKTNAPALQYTNMMPILLENKRYVWQVRALTNNPANPNEQSYFRNNGNSETFYFDLVSNCEAPRMLTAMTESTSAQLRWSAQAMMPNQEYPYKVMYRERGKSWKSQKVSMPYAKVIGLKRGRTYIYKVGVACGLNAANSTSVFGEDSYVYSTEQEFTTTEQIDEKSQVQCGVKPEIRIKNTEPLQDNLYPNTTFRAGDFPVTVLNATGSNGVYSGEGYVKVPYLQDTKIKVVFNGIKLNTERQLIDGKLVTTYDETERNVVEVSKEIGDIIKEIIKEREERLAELEALEKKKNEINESDYQKKRETIFKSLQETNKEIATQIENLSKSPFLSENSRKELTDVKTYYQTDKRQASIDDSFFNQVRKKDKEVQQKVSDFDKEVKENKRLAVEQLNEQQSKGEPWYKNYKAFNKLQKLTGYEIWYKATADWIKEKRSIGTVFFLPDNKTLLLHTSEALPTDGENPPSTTEVTKKEGYFYYYNEDFDNKWHKVVDLPSSYKKLDLEPLFIEGYKGLGRMLSFENGLILITGKDFDGEEASRLKAGGFLILEFAPLGRIWKVVKEPLKVAVSGVKGTFRTLAFEGGKWVSKTGIDKKAIEIINKGKKLFKITPKIDEALLNELNSLRNSDVAIAKFVEQNIDVLSKNSKTVWEMNSQVVRGRVWEQIRIQTDLKGWEFIGGQNQKLLDFFYDKTGIIMQQKTIGSITEATLKSYKSSYKKIIKELDNVVRTKSYVLQGGKRVLQVKRARLDIVVQEGVDISTLKNELERYIIDQGSSVTLKVIVK